MDGDIYATATDDTLLHLGYEALTPLELDLPFALKIFTLIQSNEFLALLNVANTPENFAKVVRTAIVVGDFLIRNPHIHYNDWPAFNGVTGVDRAVQIVADGLDGRSVTRLWRRVERLVDDSSRHRRRACSGLGRSRGRAISDQTRRI